MTNLIKRYRRDDRGQIAVFFAMMAVPLLAVTSAAVDYTGMVGEQRNIKGALDAAVIAAVNNNAIPLKEKPAFAETHFRANYNGKVDLTLESTVESDAVSLNAQGYVELMFGRTIGIDNPRVNETSAAQIASENTICVLALSEDADESITFGDQMQFMAPNCTVHSNSTSSSAIVAKNNVQLAEAKSFCAVGGVQGEYEPHAKGECRAIEDPYAAVPAPMAGPCVKDFLFETGGELHPVDIAMGIAGTRGLGGLGDVSTGPAALPTAPPAGLDTQLILDELYLMFGEEHFDPSVTGSHKGNSTTKVEWLFEMGGQDMARLLELYNLSPENDGLLYCKNPNKLPGCTEFNNPFDVTGPDTSPTREVVAAVFDIMYGEYIPEPVDTPEILTKATISYIAGKLYSRNNATGELRHISKNLAGNKATLTPGTYCGGLTVDGFDVKFQAGDYVFKDGPLTFLDESEADANNVTFAFMGKGATLNIEEGSDLTIKAPKDGARKGLAFMEVPSKETDVVPGQAISRIRSGGRLSMAGTAYLPTHSLEVQGEDSHLGSQSPAVGLIANNVKFTGESGSRVEIDIDHQAAGIPPIEPRAEDGARLVR